MSCDHDSTRLGEMLMGSKPVRWSHAHEIPTKSAFLDLEFESAVFRSFRFDNCCGIPRTGDIHSQWITGGKSGTAGPGWGALGPC